MAIQIRKLGTRAVTAAVFVVVLLSCMLFNYYSFTFFFFVVAMWGLLEFFQVAEKMGAAPHKKTGFVIGGLTYLAFVHPSIAGSGFQSNPLLPLLVCFPFILLAVSLSDRKTGPFTNALFTLGGVVYAVLPFGLLHRLVITSDLISGAHFQPYTLLGVILLIWCNDTFAYLGGSVLGKRKMVERISPGKTWEGTVTGVLVAFALSFLIRNYLADERGLFWPVAGVLVPVLATAGDLLQSVIKRQAGVKDTGSIMPGHGGILDRFDSLIFVTPFVVVVLELIAIQNVSG